MKVRVYRDRHRGCWSVSCARTGRVTNYVPADNRLSGRRKVRVRVVMLRDVTFVVRPAGRESTVRTGRRTVHAWLVGYTTNIPPKDRPRLIQEVGYDPFAAAHFTDKATGRPVRRAAYALCVDGRVFTLGAIP